MILKNDMSAEYLKSLTPEQRKKLCSEIRQLLVKTVTVNGGHLASNLGTVELTVAMHTVFDSPKDKFVFDVGHQSYTHKIITGRAGKMNTLRCEGGISGFPKAEESEHDVFIGGHSSISISAALGIAEAMRSDGDDHSVVAVIGDGALTGGEAYEGLNNAGKSRCNLIVVLNDNEMSISKNTGALALYLAQIRSTRKYYSTKNSVKNVLDKTPIIGKGIGKAVKGTKQLLKYAIYHSNLFEDLGFKYLGPIDGHNLDELTEALMVAKMMQRPCLVHIYTKKGKGYAPAEDNSGEYHGLPPKKDDDNNCKGECFTDAFGKALLSFADKDNSIYAVTAAMKYGTGLQHFYKAFPERFFDVGIAEQHAVTFSAGLASQGKLPVFAVYSSFLQRSYDQLIHDCAIEKRHIVLGIDRAGFVGEDGETHHGLFDVAMLTTVPGVTVYSPSDTAELSQCLEQALYKDKGVVAVRYPRGCELYRSGTKAYSDFRHVSNKSRKLIFTYGRISAYAYTIHGVDVLQAIKIFPIADEIINICLAYDEIYAFEEGEREGGIAQKLCTALALAGFKGRFTITAVDGFVRHADVATQLHNAMLDADGMRKITGE